MIISLTLTTILSIFHPYPISILQSHFNKKFVLHSKKGNILEFKHVNVHERLNTVNVVSWNLTVYNETY